KAFDMASHSHIIMALKQKGVDDQIIALIIDLYSITNNRTDLKDKQSYPTGIWTGVKQGDPMSLLLFNLALDPLLCKLEEEGSRFQPCSKKIIMAFADNLVLLSGSWEEIEKNTEILKAFCEQPASRHKGKN
ncbi:PO21 protein, partial [Aegotheles bennettii]|nr:PO21 protein [Aegotheles bennettii]